MSTITSRTPYPFGTVGITMFGVPNKHRNPTPAERDERIVLPLDPAVALKAIMKVGAGLAIMLGLAVVVGCAGGGVQSGGGVQWGDYDPSVQDRIDRLADDGDCAALQGEFNTADANNAATRERTGHNNAELMKYIDGKLRSAGCY